LYDAVKGYMVCWLLLVWGVAGGGGGGGGGGEGVKLIEGVERA
jgi:hypothetical protein